MFLKLKKIISVSFIFKLFNKNIFKVLMHFCIGIENRYIIFKLKLSSTSFKIFLPVSLTSFSKLTISVYIS